MNKKNLNLAIYVSAVMVAVGVFLPLTSLPIYGEVSYMRIASLEAYLVIAFALSAPALLFINKRKMLKFSPLAVWLVLLFPALKNLFKSNDSSFLGSIGNQASGAMQDFAADLFFNVTDFSWGGLVFVLGLLLLSYSCVVRSLQKK